MAQAIREIKEAYFYNKELTQVLGSTINYTSLEGTQSSFKISSMKMEIYRESLDFNLETGMFIYLGTIPSISEYDAGGGIPDFEVFIEKFGQDLLTYRIQHVQEVDDSGKLKYIINCKGLNWTLQKRIIIPPSNSDFFALTDDVDTVMKAVVSWVTGPDVGVPMNDTPLEWEIPNLYIQNSKPIGISTNFQGRFGTLAKHMFQFADVTQRGWNLSFEPHTVTPIFYQLNGIDRTKDSIIDENEKVIIYANGKESSRIDYIFDGMNVLNHVVVGGSGELKNRVLVPTIDPDIPVQSGWNAYVDFLDAQTKNNQADLEQIGFNYIAENRLNEIIDVSLINLNDQNNKFGVDFMWGDAISIADRTKNIISDFVIHEYTFKAIDDEVIEYEFAIGNYNVDVWSRLQKFIEFKTISGQR